MLHDLLSMHHTINHQNADAVSNASMKLCLLLQLSNCDETNNIECHSVQHEFFRGLLTCGLGPWGLGQLTLADSV